jgi:hypothetical protein
MKALGLAALFLLAACAHKPEPVIRTVTVTVPVAVPCKVNVGPEPEYADTDSALRAAPDLFSRVKLLLAGRIQRMQREAELNAAVRACR